MLPPCRHILLWLLLCLEFSSPARATANGSTLKPGEALICGEKLISSNGKFVLGFFQTGSSKSSGNTTLPNWYIGIWFNKTPKFTVVWVANRENPITEPSLNLTKLTFSGECNLVIINHVTKSQIWSTKIVCRSPRTRCSRNSTAVLSDNGNLVIQYATTHHTVLWQSFDHPTDVILPGAKIGHNKITGMKYRAVSKKNLADPASGSYCMEHDPSGAKQIVDKLCNSSIVYFSTGEWNGQYLASVPEMSGNAFAYVKFIDNHQEEYWTVDTFNETVTAYIILDSDGLTKMLVWISGLQDWEILYNQPKASCDVFAVCGPFTVCNDNALPLPCTCLPGFSVKSPTDWNLDDRRGGCIRHTQLECSRKSDVSRMPDGGHTMEAVATAQE